MHLRLLQQVEGERSTRGPVRSDRALCSVLSWLDVRHCVCSRPLASGSRSSHLVWKIRTGHEAAICSSRPSAASSQMQKHFSYWRKMEISSTNVPARLNLEGKALTSHDCRVSWHLLKRMNAVPPHFYCINCTILLHYTNIFPSWIPFCIELIPLTMKEYFREKCWLALWHCWGNIGDTQASNEPGSSGISRCSSPNPKNHTDRFHLLQQKSHSKSTDILYSSTVKNTLVKVKYWYLFFNFHFYWNYNFNSSGHPNFTLFQMSDRK